MRLQTALLLAVGCAGSALAQAPVVAAGGVLNGASFAKGQPVGPGSLVSIFGTSLSSTTAQFDSVPFSVQLGGVTVTFNGVSSPLRYVSSGQINAYLPWEVLPAGSTSATVNVVVNNGGMSSAPVAVQVASVAPGIFSIPPGAGYAAAVNLGDGSIPAPAGAIPGYPTHPAKPGDAILVYVNGLGAVNPPVANGAASLDATRYTVAAPSVLINGVSAQVLFSGLSPQFPGVNQINFIVPQVGPGDSLPIQLSVNGIVTPNTVTIAIGQ